MRNLLITGNWKMNLDRGSSVELAGALAEAYPRSPVHVEIAVCPPLTYIDAVASRLTGSTIAWGAQNMHWEEKGAFTGEISGPMLKDLGCRYVILGHSERRHLMGETDEQVAAKARAAVAAGLIPIVCLGETLQQRESGETHDVVARQFSGSLDGLTAGSVDHLVMAYEPVWAIGTGKVATPEQAEEVHADLRNLLDKRYNTEFAEKVQILYGGSVKPDNARELLTQSNVDGALVGGASLAADSFRGIVDAASQLVNAL